MRQSRATHLKLGHLSSHIRSTEDGTGSRDNDTSDSIMAKKLYFLSIASILFTNPCCPLNVETTFGELIHVTFLGNIRTQVGGDRPANLENNGNDR